MSWSGTKQWLSVDGLATTWSPRLPITAAQMVAALLTFPLASYCMMQCDTSLTTGHLVAAHLPVPLLTVAWWGHERLVAAHLHIPLAGDQYLSTYMTSWSQTERHQNSIYSPWGVSRHSSVADQLENSRQPSTTCSHSIWLRLDMIRLAERVWYIDMAHPTQQFLGSAATYIHSHLVNISGLCKTVVARPYVL